MVINVVPLGILLKTKLYRSRYNKNKLDEINDYCSSIK